MADLKSAERIVLKVLAGAQAGAEVSLEPGEYVIGTGPDDDIQFIDVSMKPAHARARLASGKIEIKAASAPVLVGSVLRSSEEDWQEVQPLDVMTTGTTRFAFGPPMAQWGTIADHGELSASPSKARPSRASGSGIGTLSRIKALSAPIALLALLLAVATVFLATRKGAILSASSPSQSEAQVVRAALDQFQFGRAIAVRQDVDGAVYVTGFVEAPVERRAVVEAINNSGVSVRLRLGVIQVLRSEVDGLIKAENVKVSYDLSPFGDLRLRGLILDSQAAEQFVAKVSQNVIGLNSVHSQIRTAKTLLGEIRDLAHLSDIDDAVVFRLNGTVIDANGAITTSKIDEWVGFLQAYSKRFGDDIGLRSYVQLQSEVIDVSAPSPSLPLTPVLLGAVPSDKDIDGHRLNSGDFKAAETFAAPKQGLRTTTGDTKPAAAGRPIATAGAATAQSVGVSPEARPAPGAWRASAGDVPSAEPDPRQAQVAPSSDADPVSNPPAPTYAVVNPTLPAEVGLVGRSASADATYDKAGSAGVKSANPGSVTLAPGRMAEAGGGSRNARSALDGTSNSLPTPPPKVDKREKPVTSGSGTPQPASRADPASKDSGDRAALPATFRHDVGDMSAKAGALMDSWLEGDLKDAGAPDAQKNRALEQALDTLANNNLDLATPPLSLSEASKELFAHKYLPLFALSRQSNVDAARQCRPGSRLSLDDLPAALFWLDLMSTTSAVSLNDFGSDAEGFILEAALNPGLVAGCLRRDPSMRDLISNSIYLEEAARNPEFVRFVTHILRAFSLDVTGASLEALRFIQMRDGSKLHEGEAPDAGSRIDTIGELGVAVLLADGYATIIYGPDINWVASR